MTAKEWLQRGWRLEREINTLEEAKRRAYDRCISSTTRTDSVPSGTASNFFTLNDKMNAYADFAALVDERIDELVRVKTEVMEVIRKVDNTTLRTLLIARYINFRTWEQIAVEMDYSYQHVVQNLHPQALERVDSILYTFSAMM